WKNTTTDASNSIYFDHNMFYSPTGAPIVNSTTDYPQRLGYSYFDVGRSDKNQIMPAAGNANPFGIYDSAPGGAGSDGSNSTRTGPGYTTLVTGLWPSMQDRLDSIAAYFKIDADSSLYHAGREITKTEVNDDLWGRISGPDNVQGTTPHVSTVQYGDPNLFDNNEGYDYFGNLINRANPSVGACEP
ncbi:MAG: hypothetical protein FWF29_11445, partial [Treponema sp.]|nr:hypothetical protein [Treponema sp.]